MLVWVHKLTYYNLSALPSTTKVGGCCIYNSSWRSLCRNAFFTSMWSSQCNLVARDIRILTLFTLAMREKASSIHFSNFVVTFDYQSCIFSLPRKPSYLNLAVHTHSHPTTLFPLGNSVSIQVIFSFKARNLSWIAWCQPSYNIASVWVVGTRVDSKLEAKTAKVDGSLPNAIWRGVEARATPLWDRLYLFEYKQ